MISKFLHFPLYHAKGDNERNSNAISTARDRNLNEESHFQSTVQGQIDKDQPMQDSERSYLTDQLKGFASTGGITDAQRSSLTTPNSAGSSGGGGGGGGTNVGGADSPFAALQNYDYNKEYKGYEDISKNGGVDLTNASKTYSDLQGPNAIDNSKINDSYNALKEFGATGGVTQQDREALNRPLYTEFEKTGGYSDPQLADIRARSNASVPSFYNNLQDQLDLRRRSQGYGSGMDAATRNLTRQSAQGSAENARNTEIDLAERQRTGRMDAAKQLSANELGLLNITTPAKQQALSNAGGLATNQQDLITKTKLAAAQGDVQAQQLIQSGKLAGLGGMTGTQQAKFGDAATKAAGTQQWDLTNRSINASSSANAAANALGYASLNAANQRFLIGQESANKQGAYGDLLNLYKSAPGALTQDEELMLSSMGQEGGVQQGLINSGISNSQLPGKYATGFDNIMKGAGAVTGAISGFSGLGGGGGSGGIMPIPQGGLPDWMSNQKAYWE